MYPNLKRFSDFTLALVLSAALSPLFLLLMVLVLVDSGRPIFFKQMRVGLHGKHFQIYKFRTLYHIPHEVTDPRAVVTPVGKVLRRWGLDELPQLVNVLKNDMSLVGPRPTIPEQVARYSPFEKQRLTVRPGITGWAQIHGRNALDWPDRIKLDVEYIRTASMFLDASILIRTPLSLMSKNDTYGRDGKNADFSGFSRAE